MKNLAVGMDARVRPPAPVNPHRPAEDLAQAGFDHVLDGRPARLALPAGEGRAVIGAEAFPPLLLTGRRRHGGIMATASRWPSKKILEDEGGGARIDQAAGAHRAAMRFGDRGLRLVAGQPLVDQVHRQAESGAQPAGEGLDLLGHEAGRAVHVERMAHDQIGDPALLAPGRPRAAQRPAASDSTRAGSGVATPSSSP